MYHLMLLKYNIRLLLLISLFFTHLISSEWIYQADQLNAKTINNLEITELIGNVIIKKENIIIELVLIYMRWGQHLRFLQWL